MLKIVDNLWAVGAPLRTLAGSSQRSSRPLAGGRGLAPLPNNHTWHQRNKCSSGRVGCIYIIGRTASDEVVLELIRTKCIPILLYGLEVLPLYQYQLRSLDFVINRLFMKLFRTNDIQLGCCSMSGRVLL